MRDMRTAWQVLEDIAKIEDRGERIAALREQLTKNNPLAIIIQHTYHPDVNYRLPPGPLPATIAKKSGHDDRGPMLYQTKRLNQFMNQNLDVKIIERNFISLYEGVSDSDADLLICIKDKFLPWDSLNADFCLEAVPELFPNGVLQGEPYEDVEEPVIPKLSTATLGDVFNSGVSNIGELTGEDREIGISEQTPVKRKRGRPRKNPQ